MRDANGRPRTLEIRQDAEKVDRPTWSEDRRQALRHLEWSVTQMTRLLGGRGPGPLTAAQLMAMRYLLDGGPATVGSVARAIGASLSSTTGLIDRLEQLRLVERNRSPNDRRTVTVTVTHEGRRVVGEILEDRITLLDRVFSGLQVESLWALHDLLHESVVSHAAIIEVS